MTQADIDDIRGTIAAFEDRLQNASVATQEEFDALSETGQSTRKGRKLETLAEELSDAHTALQECIEALDRASDIAA